MAARGGRSAARLAGNGAARRLTRKRNMLLAVQLRKLQAMLRAILPSNSFYAAKFSAVPFDPRRVRGFDEFQALPFTTKHELLVDQATHPPYGANLTYPIQQYCRLHQSSGTATAPLRWLDTPESWDWFLGCWRTIYQTIGLEQQDRLFFPFSFGPFLGFWGAFEGAARQGNLCLPGGGMTTSARLRFMLENQVTLVACTPTYALRMAEVAEEEGINLADSPVRALIVAGEPGGSIPSTRAKIESSWGVRVIDHFGMTEIGALGIECIPNPGGLHLLETECIAEVIDPNTSTPVPEGQCGELVLTNLGRWGSPLIRYRTGDLVQLDPHPCSCGMVWARLPGGILGRTDDMVIIRGNNLHPSALEGLLRSIPEVGEWRCLVRDRGGTQRLKIMVERAGSSGIRAEELADRVSRQFQDRFHFRAEVEAVRRGSLPRSEMKSQRFVRE